MSDQRVVEGRLGEALHKAIDYFRQEYNVTYAQVIGVLAMVQSDIQREADALADDDEECRNQ